ncbi:hypothetical protein SESBI_25794 [Sesbania bispinosa]|nr:hypothetical protein SESBI_25794 [Sesbania bispinosa]
MCLRVEPTQALVHAHHALLSPLCFLLNRSANKRGWTNMPSPVSGGFLVVLDVLLSVSSVKLLTMRPWLFSSVSRIGSMNLVNALGGVAFKVMWRVLGCEACLPSHPPWEQKVGDDAVGWELLREMLDGSPEEHGGFMDPGGVVEIGDVGEVFDALREANFVGGEWNGVDAEVVVGRDGFVKELGVGGSGDDGHVWPA